MKLTEIKNEAALDALAELINPITELSKDTALVAAMKEKKILEATKMMLKDHKPEVLQIFAILDGTPVEEYECNLLTLPSKLIEILSDDEVMRLFS